MEGMEEEQEIDLRSLHTSEGDFVHVAREPEYTLALRSWKTVHSIRGDYTAYCIMFQTHSPSFHLKKTRVWRRFSEFLWLRKELSKLDSWKHPPALPSRRLLNHDPDLAIIQHRQDQLEKWLYTVLSEVSYLSSTALHLFLQTELSTKEIEDYLEGKIPDEHIRQVWANHGMRYNYQPHNPLHNVDYQEPTEIRFSAEEDMAQQVLIPEGSDQSAESTTDESGVDPDREEKEQDEEEEDLKEPMQKSNKRSGEKTKENPDEHGEMSLDSGEKERKGSKGWNVFTKTQPEATAVGQDPNAMTEVGTALPPTDPQSNNTMSRSRPRSIAAKMKNAITLPFQRKSSAKAEPKQAAPQDT